MNDLEIIEKIPLNLYRMMLSEAGKYYQRLKMNYCVVMLFG